jgi:hypothetical protein
MRISQRPKRSHHLPVYAFRRARGGDVLDDDEGIGAGGQFGGKLFEQLAAPGEHTEPAAFRRQFLRDCPPEPDRGTGHQGHVPRQLQIHSPVPSNCEGRCQTADARLRSTPAAMPTAARAGSTTGMPRRSLSASR